MSVTSTNDDTLLQLLERERQAIWTACLTDEARQQAWSQRKAQVLSFLAGDSSSTTRGNSELGSQAGDGSTVWSSGWTGPNFY
jgi:putative component of toxin-antitoxin plasmid stabilization module